MVQFFITVGSTNETSSTSDFCRDVEQLTVEVMCIRCRGKQQSQMCQRCSGRGLINKMTVLEAITFWVEERGIEPALAADMLNADLKERLRVEAQSLHQLQRSAALQF